MKCASIEARRWCQHYDPERSAVGQSAQKSETPERVALRCSDFWPGCAPAIILCRRLLAQNAPKRIAPTKTKTTQTARTSHFTARATACLLCWRGADASRKRSPAEAGCANNSKSVMRIRHAGIKHLIARTKKHVRKFAAVQYSCAVPPGQLGNNANFAGAEFGFGIARGARTSVDEST